MSRELDEYRRVVDFAVDVERPDVFLNLWQHGEWDKLEREYAYVVPDWLRHPQPEDIGVEAGRTAVLLRNGGEVVSLTVGDTYGPNESGMFTSGINLEKHGNAIECHAKSAERAEGIRDAILHALRAVAIIEGGDADLPFAIGRAIASAITVANDPKEIDFYDSREIDRIAAAVVQVLPGEIAQLQKLQAWFIQRGAEHAPSVDECLKTLAKLQQDQSTLAHVRTAAEPVLQWWDKHTATYKETGDPIPDEQCVIYYRGCKVFAKQLNALANAVRNSLCN